MENQAFIWIKPLMYISSDLNGVSRSADDKNPRRQLVNLGCFIPDTI